MVVPSLTPSMSKPELRAAMRTARNAYVASLAAEEREALQSALPNHNRPLIERSAVVGGYHAVGGEIDPAPALALAEQSALPTFDEAEEPFRFRLGPADAVGLHGIPQPALDSPELSCALILVPLLAIDQRGHRLGQGGGHYDRVLPALREAGATLIGVGWDMQRLDFDLPREPWDVSLDGFASPSGLEMFR
jgi:5-formyltetrahydrofolate cyclo-ligase